MDTVFVVNWLYVIILTTEYSIFFFFLLQKEGTKGSGM